MMPVNPDTVLISRIQFAFTIVIIFSGLPIRSAFRAYIVLLNALWLKTGRPVYHDLLRF